MTDNTIDPGFDPVETQIIRNQERIRNLETKVSDISNKLDTLRLSYAKIIGGMGVSGLIGGFGGFAGTKILDGDTVPVLGQVFELVIRMVA